MKPLSCLASLTFIFGLGLALLTPATGRAQYHSYNVTSGSDCIMQDYRSANLPGGIYDAIHEEYVTSSDGGSAYFYGGMTHENNVNGVLSTLVQYSMWPPSGVYGPYVMQIPTFAGTNMTWWASTAEGSSCSIKGYWPMFSTNLSNRFVVRYWPPGNGTAHQGYQGMWMKDPTTGNWYHLGTLFYPFASTGVTGMSGWQENFSGYTGDYIVQHSGGYYHYSGAWNSASQIHFTGGGGTSFCQLVNTNTAGQSSCGPDYTNNVPITLTVTQPSLPTFDPIVVTNYGASLLNTQVLVQWQLPLTSSPQLSYKVEVFNNSNYTGSASFTAFDNDPEARQKLLAIPGVATPYVRLTIADIFFNTNAPILITPAAVTPSPATNVTGTAGGLAFQYYEPGSGDWTVLPNFSSLTPVYNGVVAFPDPTPRRKRTDYGFNYSGFITVSNTGLYAFTLHSGDGSSLTIDGTNVINFDGLHDSSQFKSGGIALAAGQHAFNVQFFKGAANPVNTTAYTDGLGLTYEGPGLAPVEVPASAFSRVPGTNEPTITLAGPTNNATVLNSNPGITPTIVPNGATINSVQYFLTDYSYYYFTPNPSVDYFLGSSVTVPYNLNAMVWTAATNTVRARLVYNGTNMIDSAPVTFAATNSTIAPWTWAPLDLHDHPSGVSIQGNTLTLVGDNMNLLGRQVSGDCTLIGRMAGITPNVAGPDGLTPDGSWRGGIILRGTTNDTSSQPLGDGGTTRFIALFGSVGGGSYFEDDTMRGGNGDANSWSGNQGNGNKWYKLQRVGNQFTGYLSADGVNWNMVRTTNLTSFGTTIYAGVFTYALPEPNPNVFYTSFDNFSLTGTNVIGPASVAISPQTNAVIGGLPATFSAAVIGPIPTNYQWQLNGTNIAGATNSSYTVVSATTANVGNYTVYVSGVTSAPAALVISAPAGSGVWTNTAGGVWTNGSNWSGGTAAGGVDAVADFSTLNLTNNVTVSLNGSNTVGTLLFDDQNLTAQHNWTLSTGTGGPLTLAVSSGTPGIAVQHATNIISAVLAGTGGFTKTGPGYLTLSGSSTVTGLLTVGAGTLEMQNKSGDTPYVINSGTTLKIGYSTGGGYANTAMTINGSGVNSTNGFYLAGGKTYNCSGQIQMLTGASTIRQYGSGMASLGIFDINGTGLWCESSASGSVIATNVQMVSDGYGMSIQTDVGVNTATGDLTINGPLNVGSLGFYKRGGGSILLNGVAATGNAAVQIQAGTVLCGSTNCLGTNASVPISSGASLQLGGYNQTVSSLNVAAGGTLSFGGTNLLAVSTPPGLAGSLQMVINKAATPFASTLQVGSGTLTNGGTLTVVNQSTGTLAAGDTFTLFSAPGYTGNFSSVSLPPMPVGLVWNASGLATNGTLVVASVSSNAWNGGGNNTSWSNATNWSGTAPANWNLLTFQGTVRPANTNDWLTAAGQIIFANGGFSLGGNALGLQWGLLSLAGNNTNAIGLTLAAAQSFVSSNGLLAVTAPVTNGGYNLTVDGAGSNIISGAISGTGALIKNGSGPLTLSSANTYSGGTTINAGKVSLGNATALGTAAVTVGAGGTLDLSTYSPANAVTLAGTGAGGLPALYGSSATNQPALSTQVTLSADATAGAVADVKTNGLVVTQGVNLGGHTLTITSGRFVSSSTSSVLINGNVNVNSGAVLYFGSFNLGTVMSTSGAITNSGTIDIRDYDNTNSSSVQTIYLNGGQLSNGGLVAPSPGNGGGTAYQAMMNGINVLPAGGTLAGNNWAFGVNLHFTGPLTGSGPLTNASSQGISLDGDPSGYTGTLYNNGALYFNGPAAQVFNGTLTGATGIQKKGANTLTLSGANTYTGGTTLGGGVVMANAAETAGVSGPLGKSAAVNAGNISFAGGTLQYGPANAYDYSGRFSTAAGQAVSVDVNGQSVTFATPLNASGETLTLTNSTGSGRLVLTATNTGTGVTAVYGGALLVNGIIGTNTVTVASGGTVGGTGIIRGATAIQFAGTLAPGYTNIGTLTVSNTLNLAGNALMRTSKNGGVLTNDVAFISGALTEGGSLIVTNIGTNAFAAGDRFKLFTAGSYTGSFTNLTLPALNPGLQWYTNTLAASGAIAVSNVTFTLAYAAGTNGTLSGATAQTVNYGASGSTVTAVANSGYHFVNWSDGGTANPRTDTGVTNNVSVTANFAATVTVMPVVSGAGFDGSQFLFTFSGTNGQTYKVLSTTNLMLPLTNWSIISTGAFGVSPLTFTSSVSAGAGYFRVLSP